MIPDGIIVGAAATISGPEALSVLLETAMLVSEYASHDGLGLAALIRSRQISVAEASATALAAVEAVDPHVNAIVESWRDERPSGAADAPFHGVPFLIKDLAITMAGRRNELGSRLAAGQVAGADSELMGRFRRAGLVTLGRTTTPEMAASTTTEGVATGATRNPWNTDRSAGGSSGGSGAAVGSGMVPIAHATDGGGSIRVPASANGVFGLKPTRGRVSNGPAVDEVWSGLAVQFALSRSVRDSAALLDVVRGGGVGEPYYIPDPERPYLQEVARDPGALRIGMMRHPLDGRRCDAAVSEATDRVSARLADLGHHVEEVKLDIGVSWDGFVHANAQFWTANTAAWLDAVVEATGRTLDEDVLEPATRAISAYGRQSTALDLLGALHVRNLVTRSMGAYFGHWDILFSPTLSELPLPIGEYNRDQGTVDGLGWIGHVFRRSPFTAVANVAGLPAMSVPLSIDDGTGLPIGSQFVAGFGREDVLFRLAGQLERAMPWADRRPGIWAGTS